MHLPSSDRAADEVIAGAPPGPDTIAFHPSSSLASRQVDAMVAAWRRGERPLAEEFLARHPELGSEAAIRLIFEECCLRQEAGLEVDPAELARRFPRWWPELEVLLDCHRLMGADSVADFPSVGGDLAGFRLLAELGRGVTGRVFLASQPALADRLVVLKVTPRGRHEHLSLAQLQHMNIVPLYSAQVLHGRDLQVLCMPFLGGASLAQVSELLEGRPPAQRTGKQLIDALDQLQARLPIAIPSQHLARSGYVEAICWIGVCLADGLQYAHDCGLVHMDLKPSNVLLAGDGQPMLLDFHLARGPIDPGDPTPPWMGGTPDYMAPEQFAAMAAVREGRPIPAAVDGRADLFALGLVLYEALSGSRPGTERGIRRPLHCVNPLVSVGLSDIIHKCLRHDPRDRYPSAAALAADLRRHLNDLPLQGVPNRSLTERWHKWRRRRPDALPRGLILLVSVLTATVAAALLWSSYRQQTEEVETALSQGRAAVARHEYAAAARAFQQGLALAVGLPAHRGYQQTLQDELARAQRDAKAADLHRLVELIRFRYGLDPPPPDEANSLIRRGREIWRTRAALLRPIGGRREPELEQTLRADLLDFALVWADLRVRSAPPGQADEARKEALDVLNDAESRLGPSPALARDRRALVGVGEWPATPAMPPIAPRSAWEHYDLGRSYLRSGQIAPAAEQFQLGLDLRPQDFWLNFYQGLCAYRLGRFEEAVSAFRVCVALAPETAECYYNRALALASLGRIDQALGDYTRALERNPSLTEAALNRGLLYYQKGRLADAAADLKQALATAPDPKVQGTIHYNLALVELARGARALALSELKAAVNLGHAEARGLQEKLRP
jgi:serine/threonine protein kinase/lipoprotein NlpI